MKLTLKSIMDEAGGFSVRFRRIELDPFGSINFVLYRRIHGLASAETIFFMNNNLKLMNERGPSVMKYLPCNTKARGTLFDATAVRAH